MRFLASLLTFCLALSAARAETRVALVIGNDTYSHVGRLDNPVRDAAAVAQGLREAGFQTVQVESNLGHDALIKALRRFEEAADNADWALVYYAGHGIEVGGTNYLIPVDARIASDRDIDEEAISLTQVQKRLEGVRKLRLVILDACRDNPFLAKMRRTQVSSRSVGHGLAVPELPQSGSLVAYSAAAGQVALDGETSTGNSPYAAALIKNLSVPDVEVNLFFRRVRVAVLRATGNKQEPATYESLPDDRFVVRPALLPMPQSTLPLASPPAPLPTPIAAPSPVAVLKPILPEPNIAPNRQTMIDACDRLAAARDDSDRPTDVVSVSFKSIDIKSATSACRAAISAGRSVWATSNISDPEPRRMLFQLGRVLDAGHQYGKAKLLYEQAAASGSIIAKYSLGILYARGDGVAQDFKTARNWFEKAAAAGYASAMFNLGTMYGNGHGVREDFSIARNWFEKAAAAGDADAMQSLGAMYFKGDGVAQNFRTARSWFEKAAVAGNTDAMLKLGALYTKGDGVAQDFKIARSWFEKAAATGDADAKKALSKLPR